MYCKNQASTFSYFCISLSLATGGNLFVHINSAHPTNTCIHVRTHAYTHHAHNITHTHTCLPAHLCLCAHTLTHARTYIHGHIHTHTHTHTLYYYIYISLNRVVQWFSQNTERYQKRRTEKKKNEAESVTDCCMLVVTVGISIAKTVSWLVIYNLCRFNSCAGFTFRRIYLVRANMVNMKLIADHVIAERRQGQNREYTIIMVPRRVSKEMRLRSIFFCFSKQ